MRPISYWVFWILLATLAVLSTWKMARGEPLITDLSTHQVELKSTFTGTDILVFGAVEEMPDQPGVTDIVIIIEGPNRTITVRRKEKLGPIWVNNDAHDFEAVPAFVAVRSTRPLTEIADPILLSRLEIGIDHLALPIAGEAPGDAPEDIVEWQQSIRRNMIKAGLYSESAEDIRFIGKSLFRTTIDIPANVPPGTYTALAYLFRDGQIVTAQVTPLFIDKKGFERAVYITATDYSWGYGILAVIIALLSGWGAAVLFRKT